MPNERQAPPGVSRWEPSSFTEDRALPLVTAADAVPIVPGLDLWDFWPLQHEDGLTATVGGRTWWFFLSAPQFPDPGARHNVARLRLVSRGEHGWSDHGDALPEQLSPGSREWAGSAVLLDDARTVLLFFTAAGQRGAGFSFQQRMFVSRGTMTDDGPVEWQQPQEVVVSDGARYVLVDQAEGAPGIIKAFRDPAWFRDPRTGARHILFTGSAGWSDDPYNGVVGLATLVGEAWQLEDPLIEAVGVNNELERPHIVVRDGRYYLFWSTQRRTFSPSVDAGPNGLYAMVADDVRGPYAPVNGTGLVAANPAGEPTQAYSWWVTGEGEAWSFIDHWGMAGRRFEDHPELLRSQFGGTPAPTVRLTFSGDRVEVAGPVG